MATTVTRRRIAALLAASTATASPGLAGSRRARGAPQDTIKVGQVAPLTGALAEVGH